MIKIAVFCVVACVMHLMFPVVGVAQDTGSTATPEPYDDEEFDKWLRDVRRFEVIAVGSLPLTYLLSVLVFDVGRFVVESIRAGSINGQYAPLFFAPPNKPAFTNDEQLALLLISAGMSVAVAVLDIILVEIARNDAD